MKLFFTISQLVRFYQQWLGDEPPFTELQTAIIVDGVWKSVPLIDLDEWVEHVEQFGLPIIMRDRVADPPGFYNKLRLDSATPSILTLLLAAMVGMVLGIPSDFYTRTFGVTLSRAKDGGLRFPSDSNT